MIFAGCAALQGEGNTCTVCEGHCGVSAHYHARKTVQTVRLHPSLVTPNLRLMPQSKQSGRTLNECTAMCTYWWQMVSYLLRSRGVVAPLSKIVIMAALMFASCCIAAARLDSQTPVQ